MVRIPLILAALLLASVAAANGQQPGMAFRERCAALAREAESRSALAVAGRDGWLYLTAELRHLGAGRFWGAEAAGASRASNPDWADPLPAIVDFHDQLTERGVRLLVVPVPPKAVIYPEGLPDDEAAPAGRLDADLQSFYGQLRFKGIQVLDLTPVFLKHRARPGGALFCRQDSHWSGTACALAASEIGMELFATFDGCPRQAFTGDWEQVEISGDLWKSLDDPRPAREQLRLRRVRAVVGGGPADPDADSPVLLLGDSHCLVFHAGDDMLARGAGLPDQLAIELGFPVDLAAVRGSGATPARINLLRRAQKDPKFWARKRWVVWCFSAREFTESDGWRRVPIAPVSPKPESE